MFAQYLLHNNKTFSYIKHALYKFDKKKMTFENYYTIDAKLFQQTFNCLKFHVRIYFVKCIWHYRSAINNNMAYNKAVYKYFFKVLYKQTNKKKHKLQIILHINVIAMQNAILIAKVL